MTVEAASNRLASVQEPSGSGTATRPYSYDAAGNLTGDGVNTFVYSDRGRMSSAITPNGTVSYLVNGLEQRVSKTGPTVPTGAAYFVFDEEGHPIGEYGANGAPVYEVIYLGDTPVGVVTASGIGYVYSDHIDTPRVIARSSDHAIVWRWNQAEAFGATPPNEDPNGFGAFTFNLRFPGQVYDRETGLFYNGYRDYRPSGGRYDQYDPIGIVGGINQPYTYGTGNPLSYIDPLGLAGCKWVGFAMICDVGPPPVVDPEYPSTVPPSTSAPGFRNPFDGMFSSPRPRNMTSGQERQFDRYCVGAGDPCKEIKDAADKAIAAALPKVEDMLGDRGGLFGGPGWKTHRDGLEGRMNAIADMIALGQMMGCDMSDQIRKFTAVFIPTVPRKFMKP